MTNFKNLIRIFFILTIFCGTVWAQTTVQVSPSTKNVATGGTFSLDIIINNVTDLHAASVTVKFTKTLIQYTGVSQGPFLGSNGDNVVFFPTPSPAPADDSLKVDQAILGQGKVTGSGTLFTMTFVALQQIGTSPITLANVDLRDQNNAYIASSNVNGQVTVTAAVFSLSPTNLSFGDVVRGANKRDSVTVTNNGNTMLHISSVVSDNPQFTVSPGADSISALSSKKYYITFTPSSAGTTSGNIIFTHDATGSPDTVTVSGRGTEPHFNKAPTNIDYGNVIVGQNKRDSVTISNSGTATLHVTSITSTSGQFTVTPASDSVAPSGSQKIYITFAPTSSGAKSGKIILVHDATGSPDSVTLTGTGVVPIFSVNPTNRDFGTIVVGTSKLDSVTVTNTGTSTLHITSVTSDLGDFTVLPSNGTIAPSASLIFRITFAPSTGGVKHGHIIFIHDASTSPDSVTVTGTAVYTGSISGLKFNDINGNGLLDSGEPGIAGWKIALGGASIETTQTNGSGAYSFTALAPESYTLTEVPETGWIQTSSAPSPVILSLNQNVTGIDFGNFQLVSISGTKFNDLNGNGAKDAGEPGLQGWTIFLDANNDGILDNGETNQSTDVNGNYTFSNNGPGTYKVREVGQSGWLQTTSTPADVIPGSGTNVNNINFGNFHTISISGTKFNDLNGNGVKDAGEPGLSGWTIYIDANLDGTLDNGEINQATDVNGDYSFNGLTPGTYRLREVDQSGWSRSTTNPADIVLTSGTGVSNVNFGNFQLITISGTKFNDLNGNGVKDAGESGLKSWTIFIDANQDGLLDNGETSQVTDDNGEYTFSNLGPGTYRLREVQQNGWSLTTTNPSDIPAQSGTNITGVNFGNFQLIGISGMKFNDVNGNGSLDAGEPGLQGWTMFLDVNDNGILDPGETTTSTDLNGNYTFSNVGPGTYKVREVDQSGWVRTTANPTDIVLTSGTSVNNINFGNFQNISISGMKFNDLNGNGVKDAGEPGLQGWMIFLDANLNETYDSGEPNQLTDVNGNYVFTNLGPGTYRLREVQQSGWMQMTTNPVDVTAQSGTNVSAINFGNFQLVSISGFKFNDLNGNGTKDAGEPGLQGWTIFLDANNNGTYDNGETNQVTDLNGNYTISNLGPGTYKVREVQQGGWLQTSSNPADIIPTGGTNVSNVNFGNFQTTSISGIKFNDVNGNGVKDAGEPGLSGWTIFLDANLDGTLDNGESNHSTDVNGNYSFNGLAPGTYRVREVGQSGWLQTTTNPSDITLSSGTTVTNVNFGNFQLISIGGTKYNDLNGNGVKDAGEPGLKDWTIYIDMNRNDTLTAGEQNQLTDDNGSYVFTDLGPGTYRLREVQQVGWTKTSANPVDITVQSGTNVSAVDFGNFELVSISGTKFNDINGNGTMDAGEPVLQGWTIYLDANNNGIMDAGETRTTTDINGNYTLTNVGPGNVKVREVDQNGWLRTTTNPVDIIPMSGTNVSNINFGNFQKISISGTKFNDINGNGVKDAGEPGLQGWTMFLDANQNGTLDNGETNQQTDVSGNYMFSNLGPGTYRVREVQQGGWVRTTANPTDTTVLSGTNVSGVDFGNFQLVSISGTKINDLNGNGTKDAGEPGLQGWTMYLDVNSNGTLDAGEPSTTTNVSGTYTFTGLTPGTYRVREVAQAGWIQTSGNPADITVSSGSNSSGVDFCNYKIARISGMKFNDLNGDSVQTSGEPGLPGWTIHATKGATTKTIATGSDGSYAFTFDNTEVGTWVINEVQQVNWEQTYPVAGSYSIAIQSGTDTANVTFGNSQIASISGQVFNDMLEDSTTTGDAGLNNWVVKVYLNNNLLARHVTSGNGNYSFANLAPGTYVVQESLRTGWIETVPQLINAVPPVTDPNAGPRAYSVVVISGTGVTAVDFANYNQGSIRGLVYEDVDGDSADFETGDNGLSGWTVQIVKNLVQVGSVQTDSLGHYGFTGLDAGTYTVIGELKPNWYRTHPTAVTYSVQISSGSAVTGKNFGNFKYGVITGYQFFDRDSNAVRDPYREEMLANKVIVLSGALSTPETLLTDANGAFRFDSLAADAYTLKTISDAGWNQTLPALGRPYTVTVTSGMDTTGFVFGTFSVSDNFKFRTFTVKDYNMVSVTKNKKGFCKKPTAGNIRDSVFVRRGFGLESPLDSGYLRIGIRRPDSTKYYGWLFNRWKKYRQSSVKSYIFDLRSLLISKPHNKPPFLRRPPNYLFALGENTTEQKFSKYGNYLTVQLIGLKTNIAASDLRITPHGFGDLVYYASGGSDSICNNMTLRQIAALTDTVLTNGKLIDFPKDTLYRYKRALLYVLDTVLTRLNSEFTAAKIETVSTNPLIVKGAKAIFKVGYLRRDTTRILPLTNFESAASEEEYPLEYRLEQNYPNPFNPTTTIEFELPAESKVTLRIFNVLGQEVGTLLDGEVLGEGLQSVDFDAQDFATGVYFYRLEASGSDASGRVQTFTQVKKMLLMK